MKIMRILVTLAVCFLHCDHVLSDVPLYPLGSLGGLLDAGYMALSCRFKECCNDEYIPSDFILLYRLLKEHLYGQHIAQTVVLHALRSHVNEKQPKKALTMTFHGLPGTGKNYMSNFVVKALYKKGHESNYVHIYNGRLNFRSDGSVKQYQEKLRQNLMKFLKECPRSIFIFDEIEKIPAETLDILVPFLDYDPNIKDDSGVRVDPTHSIFIFLTNTGGTAIGKKMFKMWELGLRREEAGLEDFEKLLELALFNEQNAFYRSDTIESSLIDHYVPFLPLDKEHVKKCIVDAFRKRNVTPHDDHIKKVMKGLTFGPDPFQVYSEGGCKRLDQKVGSIIQSAYFGDL